MIDLRHIDELAQRLTGLVPPGLRESGDQLHEHFKAVLQSGLSRLELVTREEFDLQRAVLMRTREKLDALQRQIEALEQGRPPPASAAPASAVHPTQH